MNLVNLESVGNVIDENGVTYPMLVDGSIALKQGNILRRMGYDRGRFIVKYNFLRKFAGSYENVLVDVRGNILNRNYNPETDHEGMIKENKYFVQAISPTRQEVRLLPQNINDTKYNQKNDHRKVYDNKSKRG